MHMKVRSGSFHRPSRTLFRIAADTNMRIANATTAAQYFHLLRRQAFIAQTDPLPLVIMTPKSLLRHPFHSIDAARDCKRKLAACVG